MNDLFSRRWVIATIVAWLFIVLLDELSYNLWKEVNPGSQYTGLIVKHPTTGYPDTTTGEIANGYRPAGGP